MLSLSVCGDYYLPHRQSCLELRSKMAMRTDWGVASTIHNVVLATTQFKVSIKIWSDWIQTLSKWMIKPPHFSSPPSMFRDGYTRPGGREHEGSDPWGWNPVHSTFLWNNPQCSSQEGFTMDTPDGTASLPSPAWFRLAESCIWEIWRNKSYQLRNLAGWYPCSVARLHTHIPSLTSKLSSIIPTCWARGYITPSSLEFLLFALVTAGTSIELSGICFLAWIIVRELLVQEVELNRNRVGGCVWVTLPLVTGRLCHVLQPAGVHR